MHREGPWNAKLISLAGFARRTDLIEKLSGLTVQHADSPEQGTTTQHKQPITRNRKIIRMQVAAQFFRREQRTKVDVLQGSSVWVPKISSWLRCGHLN